MSLIFEQVLTEGIALLSYVIGDDTSGTAAVIDPRPDVEVYMDLARRRSLCITHAFETHIHADFMSGARELAARTGTARVYVSHEGGADYGYEHRPVRHGDTFEFGSLLLKAQHTPGHTPENMAYLAFERKRPKRPWGIFTGDSLFVNSAGRPDLLGEDESKNPPPPGVTPPPHAESNFLSGPIRYQAIRNRISYQVRYQAIRNRISYQVQADRVWAHRFAPRKPPTPRESRRRPTRNRISYQVSGSGSPPRPCGPHTEHENGCVGVGRTID